MVDSARSDVSEDSVITPLPGLPGPLLSAVRSRGAPRAEVAASPAGSADDEVESCRGGGSPPSVDAREQHHQGNLPARRRRAARAQHRRRILLSRDAAEPEAGRASGTARAHGYPVERFLRDLFPDGRVRSRGHGYSSWQVYSVELPGHGRPLTVAIRFDFLANLPPAALVERLSALKLGYRMRACTEDEILAVRPGCDPSRWPRWASLPAV